MGVKAAHEGYQQEWTPSTKLVYVVLAYREDDWLTMQDVAEETTLSKRSVRGSLKSLKEDGVIEDRADPREPRRQMYQLAEEEEDERVPVWKRKGNGT